MTKQRMYNVIRVRDDKGSTTQLNATPMTHDEACTFLSKLTKYSWCRDMLVDVPFVDVQDVAPANEAPALNVGLTSQQAQWAARHDWFVSAERIAGGISTMTQAKHAVTVKEIILCTESGEYGERTLEFTDYQELREWAGY